MGTYLRETTSLRKLSGACHRVVSEAYRKAVENPEGVEGFEFFSTILSLIYLHGSEAVQWMLREGWTGSVLRITREATLRAWHWVLATPLLATAVLYVLSRIVVGDLSGDFARRLAPSPLLPQLFALIADSSSVLPIAAVGWCVDLAAGLHQAAPMSKLPVGLAEASVGLLFAATSRAARRLGVPLEHVKRQRTDTTCLSLLYNTRKGSVPYLRALLPPALTTIPVFKEGYVVLEALRGHGEARRASQCIPLVASPPLNALTGGHSEVKVQEDDSPQQSPPISRTSSALNVTRTDSNRSGHSTRTIELNASQCKSWDKTLKTVKSTMSDVPPLDELERQWNDGKRYISQKGEGTYGEGFSCIPSVLVMQAYLPEVRSSFSQHTVEMTSKTVTFLAPDSKDTPLARFTFAFPIDPNSARVRFTRRLRIMTLLAKVKVTDTQATSDGPEEHASVSSAVPDSIVHSVPKPRGEEARVLWEQGSRYVALHMRGVYDWSMHPVPSLSPYYGKDEVPESIVIQVYLPEVRRSIKECVVDLSPLELRILSEKDPDGEPYTEITLPYPVDPATVKAKFGKKTQILALAAVVALPMEDDDGEVDLVPAYKVHTAPPVEDDVVPQYSEHAAQRDTPERPTSRGETHPGLAALAGSGRVGVAQLLRSVAASAGGSEVGAPPPPPNERLAELLYSADRDVDGVAELRAAGEAIRLLAYATSGNAAHLVESVVPAAAGKARCGGGGAAWCCNGLTARDVWWVLNPLIILATLPPDPSHGLPHCVFDLLHPHSALWAVIAEGLQLHSNTNPKMHVAITGRLVLRLAALVHPGVDDTTSPPRGRYHINHWGVTVAGLSVVDINRSSWSSPPPTSPDPLVSPLVSLAARLLAHRPATTLELPHPYIQVVLSALSDVPCGSDLVATACATPAVRKVLAEEWGVVRETADQLRERGLVSGEDVRRGFLTLQRVGQAMMARYRLYHQMSRCSGMVKRLQRIGRGCLKGRQGEPLLLFLLVKETFARERAAEETEFRALRALYQGSTTLLRLEAQGRADIAVEEAREAGTALLPPLRKLLVNQLHELKRRWEAVYRLMRLQDLPLAKLLLEEFKTRCSLEGEQEAVWKYFDIEDHRRIKKLQSEPRGGGDVAYMVGVEEEGRRGLEEQEASHRHLVKRYCVACYEGTRHARARKTSSSRRHLRAKIDAHVLEIESHMTKKLKYFGKEGPASPTLDDYAIAQGQLSPSTAKFMRNTIA